MALLISCPVFGWVVCNSLAHNQQCHFDRIESLFYLNLCANYILKLEYSFNYIYLSISPITRPITSYCWAWVGLNTLGFHPWVDPANLAGLVTQPRKSLVGPMGLISPVKFFSLRYDK